MTGATVINLTGQFHGSGGSIINTTHFARNLQLVSSYVGNNGVVLSGGTDAYLTVFAPAAQIVLSGGSPIFGALVGNALTVSGSSAIHFDVSLPTNVWSTVLQ